VAEQRRPLFDGLPPYDGVERDTAALLPYAELLRDLVDRRMYPRSGTELVAPSDDALFDQALRIVLERMVSDRLAALTPAEFAAAYRSISGDAAFVDALEALAERQREDVARRTKLTRMQHEARVCARVLLGELDPAEVITIGLFDPRRPELAAKRFAGNQEVRPLHRVLQVRLITPAEGRVEVVRDTWTGAIWTDDLRAPLAAPLARGNLGTAADEHAAPAPELTVHAPLTFVPEDGAPLRPPQIVGYVETLDGTLLLDGRPF
jgi:hypothetical protein